MLFRDELLTVIRLQGTLEVFEIEMMQKNQTQNRNQQSTIKHQKSKNQKMILKIKIIHPIAISCGVT